MGSAAVVEGFVVVTLCGVGLLPVFEGGEKAKTERGVCSMLCNPNFGVPLRTE